MAGGLFLLAPSLPIQLPTFKTMQLGKIIRDIATGFLEGLSLDVWVEIRTEKPVCIYYFGPFHSKAEAKKACPGYVADLEAEGAKGIHVEIKRCNPPALTISREPVEVGRR